MILKYHSWITSYDYNAPVSEGGDHQKMCDPSGTDKFDTLRSVFVQYCQQNAYSTKKVTSGTSYLIKLQKCTLIK